jgi:hypothetical protein
MSKTKKQRWNWNEWLAALEVSPVTEKTKSIGREIPPVMKRNRRALVPWELPSAPGYGELAPLVIAGLLHQIPTIGQLIPIIDPLPSPSSICVTQHQRQIIRRLLSGCDLTYTKPDSNYGPPGWRMARGMFSGVHVPINQRSAAQLAARGLLEWTGCGNWPVFSQKQYRIDMRRLHGVRGFAATAKRWLRERLPLPSAGRDAGEAKR